MYAPARPGAPFITVYPPPRRTLLTTSGDLRCQDRWRRPAPGTPEDVVHTPLTSLWEPKNARIAASWREFSTALQ